MKEKDMKFEQAMARLEEIVKELEQGSFTLDESLAAYEEGIGLLRLCTAQLENAQAKVTVLRRREDGTLTESDFS